MRFYLPLFLFGSVLLSGCADDLFGPTVEAAGITDPADMTKRTAAPFKPEAAPEVPEASYLPLHHAEADPTSGVR